MASLFNSKHNKYVSIPDWFKDTNFIEKPVESKTIYVSSGGGSVGSASGLSNVILYNKFVIESAELDKEALTIVDTALSTVESELIKAGDELSVTGWGSTGYISVAGNSTMTVTSQIVEELSLLYGILFYDNTKSVIGSHLLTSSPELVTVPANAYYFRISTPLEYEEFNVTYNVSKPYNNEQLTQANTNVTDYLSINELIPDGNNEVVFSSDSLKLLVQSPLSLTKDINNVIKLSIGNIGGDAINDMFVWDKKLAAFGYDPEAGTAYSYVEGELLFTTDDQGNQIPVTTDNPEFWMYDPELTNDWIIKTTRQRFSVFDGLMEYDAEKDSFLFHKNIITSGGIVMYADLGDVKVPDLYDGFPLDGVTIKWNYDEDGNKINISSVGSGTIKSIDILGEEGNVFEHATLDEETGILTFYKFNKYTLQDDFDVLKEQIENIKDELLEYFVTVDNTEQYISGIKHFENGIFIGNGKLYEWKDDVIYLDANLVVRGGITMYGDDGNVDIPEWYTSLPITSPLYWDTSSGKPVLSVNNASGGSGTIGSIEIVGEGNAFTSATLTDNGAKILFSKSTKFALDSDLQLKWTENNDKITNWDTAFGWGDHSEVGYALLTYVDQQDDALETYMNSTFVGIKGDYDIEGTKNFVGSLQVNGCPIVYDTQNKYWKFEGDLLVTGGITSFADDTAITPSTVMDGLVLDPNTLGFKTTTDLDGNVIKQLTVIGGTGGGTGGLGESEVKSIIESYGYLTSSDLPTFDLSDFSVSSGKVSLLGARVEIVSSTDSMSETDVLYVIV